MKKTMGSDKHCSITVIRKIIKRGGLEKVYFPIGDIRLYCGQKATVDLVANTLKESGWPNDAICVFRREALIQYQPTSSIPADDTYHTFRICVEVLSHYQYDEAFKKHWHSRWDAELRKDM